MPSAAEAGTITVDTDVDEFGGSALCSLREAVEVANEDANALGCVQSGSGLDDTIAFPNSTITPVLTRAPAGDPNDNASGDLDVEAEPGSNGTLAIQGLGQTVTLIEGGVGSALGPDRLLELESGVLAIDDVTLAQGDVDGPGEGGAIRAVGLPSTDSLSLTDVTIETSVADGGGGLSFSTGTLNITRSTFLENFANGNGGGLNISTGTAATISDSTFEQNQTTAPGLGGGLVVGGGGTTFNMDGSTVELNNTSGPDSGNRGGGIYFVGQGAPGTITDSTISDNEASGGVGGGISVGILGATLNVSDSAITGNAAFVGGGISNSGALALTRSMLSSNDAESTAASLSAVGGGLNNQGGDGAVITDSTISNNEAAEVAPGANSLNGAGISTFGTDIRIVRSTISGNFFSGTPNETFAAGIRAGGDHTLELINSTVTGNVDPGPTGSTIQGSGNMVANILGSTISGNTYAPTESSLDFGATATVYLRGSILTDPNACGPGPTAATATYNVDAGASCPAGTGSVGNANALLGPLALNGGTTLNFLPGAGSPAIDRVPAFACVDDLGTPLGVDQRGQPRPSPSTGACDAGSVEVPQPEVPQVLPPPGTPPSTGATCAGKKATITGTPGADSLRGTAGADVIAAGAGRDVVRGRGGADVICGEAGRDRLFGGGGKDTLIGGASKRDVCNGGGGTDRRARGCETRRNLP